MGMNASQITSLIAKVSHLLAPTAKYVFALYIRQAYVIGIEDLLGGLALLVGAVLSGILCYKMVKKMTTKGWDEFDNFSFFVIMGSISGGIGTVIMVITSIPIFGVAIQYLINPQWAAIQMILGHAIGGN